MVINNVSIRIYYYVAYVKYICIPPILLMLTLTTAANGEAGPFRQKRQASTMTLYCCDDVYHNESWCLLVYGRCVILMAWTSLICLLWATLKKVTLQHGDVLRYVPFFSTVSQSWGRRCRVSDRKDKQAVHLSLLWWYISQRDGLLACLKPLEIYGRSVIIVGYQNLITIGE